MIKNNKFYFLTVFLAVLLWALLPMNVFGYVWSNGAGSGYDGGGDGKRISSAPIESYIIEGAGYYLAAHADVQKLLRLVELQDLQGIDYTEMTAVIDSAIINMFNAAQTYEKLIETAEATPYNDAVISLLVEFDYNGFMTEYDLNKEIFTTAANYLQNGDITGVFKYSHQEYIDIIRILIPIRFSLVYGKLPDLSAFWKVNETYSSVSIFGSIVARIFHALDGNN